MAKFESIGAIAFAVVFVGVLIGGGGYLYVKYKPVDPLVQAEEHLKSARRLANGGSDREAVWEYSAAIKFNPNLTEAYRGRGEVLLRLQDYHEAISDLHQALMGNSDDAEALLLRAQAFQRIEDYDSAIKDLNRLLELKPEHRATHQIIANIHLTQGKFQSSVEHALLSLEQVPASSVTNRRLGWAYWGLDEYENALEPFNRAIENDPFNLHSYYGRGVTKYFLGDYEAAIEDLLKAVENDQQRTDYPNFFLFLMSMKAGHEESARTTLEFHQANRRRTRNADWPGSIGEFLLGKMTEEELFERVNETGNPPDPEMVVEGYFYAGSIRLLGGDQAGAIAHFQRCVETKVYTFYEYHSAVFELRTLGEIPESDPE